MAIDPVRDDDNDAGYTKLAGEAKDESYHEFLAKEKKRQANAEKERVANEGLEKILQHLLFGKSAPAKEKTSSIFSLNLNKIKDSLKIRKRKLRDISISQSSSRSWNSLADTIKAKSTAASIFCGSL